MEEYSAWAFALYDFDVRQAGDLAFKAGDLLQTLQPRLIGSDNGWIRAVNPRTGLQGEVPTNYITYEHGYSAALDAFKETNRSGATNLLHSAYASSEFNYVVRPSREGREMALSLLDSNRNVKHYKIYFRENDQSCCLFENQTFKTIEDLVINYMERDIEPGCILQAFKPFKDSLPS